VTKQPTRPVLRWHGGKWKLAPWIIEHFPPHRVYVEPFGGAALSPIEHARRLIIRSYMGFGSNAHNGRSTGFRSNSNRSGTLPAHDWVNYPAALAAIIDRMQGVVIENRDAMAVMLQHDEHDTLHYVDPPYLAATRSPANKYDLKYRMYRHELTDDGHIRLLDAVQELRGMVVLSGYPSEIYDSTLAGWRRVETAALADGARPRTEVLWINPQAAAALDAACIQTRMFA
jgi:DNA adenine methylase